LVRLGVGVADAVAVNDAVNVSVGEAVMVSVGVKVDVGCSVGEATALAVRAFTADVCAISITNVDRVSMLAVADGDVVGVTLGVDVAVFGNRVGELVRDGGIRVGDAVSRTTTSAAESLSRVAVGSTGLDRDTPISNNTIIARLIAAAAPKVVRSGVVLAGPEAACVPFAAVCLRVPSEGVAVSAARKAAASSLAVLNRRSRSFASAF